MLNLIALNKKVKCFVRTKKVLLLFNFIFILSFSNLQGLDLKKGESLFKSNCAACHKIDKRAIGPKLRGVENKHSKKWLYKWIKNSQDLVKSGDTIAVKLFEDNNKVIMTPFPNLSNEDIDNIIHYTSKAPKNKPKKKSLKKELQNSTVKTNEINNTQLYIILTISVLILLTLCIILYDIIARIIPSANEYQENGQIVEINLIKAIKANPVILGIIILFFMLSSTYLLYGYLMQIGIDQGYQPVQPIHFSHKIHAGNNEINCKYCHSSARLSKSAGIPSLNICMNCHKSISEYSGETTKKYSKEFYDSHIQNLYNAVGWDEETQSYTGQTNAVKWIKIHNLPDFVYFNHSQHVSVAKLDCKECHGEIEKMEIVKQASPLTMGWCLNCHRTKKIDLENNEYYKKIHEQLIKNNKEQGKENPTVFDMGGGECAKCHY